jgi:hypothetical protein
MEKYGVEENKRKEKKDKEASAEEEKCPACNTEVETHGKTRKCPVHGTEPFEKENTEGEDDKEGAG